VEYIDLGSADGLVDSMPLLSDEMVQELLADAVRRIGPGWVCWMCHKPLTRDYCRTCDVFYWTHHPQCPAYTDDAGENHNGHRLTVFPFVEVI
jgi:hypothetical protein